MCPPAHQVNRAAQGNAPAVTLKYVKPSAARVSGNCPQLRTSLPTVTVRPSKLEQPHPLTVALVR